MFSPGMLFLIGVALLLFGGSLFDGAAGIGKWLAIIGAVGIVGIPVFRGKGVGKLLGLWNLYGCTGYLGDVLSYSRLLALGLASAVIAQVFNALGGMLGHGVVAVIGFIIIAVIGHVLNFAINALGTYRTCQPSAVCRVFRKVLRRAEAFRSNLLKRIRNMSIS